MDKHVKEMLPGLFGGKKKRRKTTVAEAREILQAEEEGRLVDPGQVAREAVERAQSAGIVFLDEIDKVAGRESGGGGARGAPPSGPPGHPPPAAGHAAHTHKRVPPNPPMSSLSP